MEENVTKKSSKKKVATSKAATKKSSTPSKTTARTNKNSATKAKKTTSSTKKISKVEGQKKTTKVVIKKQEEKVIPKVEPKIEEKKVNQIKSNEKMQLENELTFKNYISIIAIILSVILVAILVAVRLSGTNKKQLSTSYLVSNKIVNTEYNKKDIKEELNKEKAFVFLTSLNNEEEYKLEKKLKKVIEENKLENCFYIYDVNNANIELNTTFNLKDRNLKIPTILYYKNGELIDVVEREDEKMIEVGDFSKLLDIYELSK